MVDNYQKIGDFITVIDNRNTNGGITNLTGISIDKCYIPSVANVIGTDLTNYKVICKGQFACSLMQVSRDQRIPIAMYADERPAIMSPAYVIFEISRTDDILPEYMELWFKRAEFDREASFYAVGGVRGSLDWDDFCKMKLPVPPIDEQRKIVHDYQVITDRIELLQKTNDILDEFLMSLYAKKIDENDQVKDEISLGDLCLQITDGKHGDCTSEENSGYYFVSVKDIINGDIDFGAARQITRADYEETHRRTKLEVGDTLFTNSGTLGKMCFIMSEDIAKTTTFQKSVAIIKPDTDKILPRTLFLTLAFNKKKLVDLAHGSAQLNLLLGDMRDFKIKVPSFKLQKNFETMVKPAFNLLQQHRDEIVELRQHRIYRKNIGFKRKTPNK